MLASFATPILLRCLHCSGRCAIQEESQIQVDADNFDDDVVRVAMLARKATRKASRAANKAGFFVGHGIGACIVRSPGQVVKIEVKTTPIDVKKRYTFASGTH